MSSDMEHDAGFLEMMNQEGVVPLKREQRAEVKRNAGDTEAERVRREAATQGEEEGLNTEYVELLHPLDPIAWKCDGVQEGVYRNLRLGKYQVDARLDLLRKTIPQCRDELLAFIAQSIKYDIRTVLINHGRSRDLEGAGNRLKSYLYAWLPKLEDVQAFHSAQVMHGGIGSIYVLLRKSDAKRLDNWEKHQKR